MPTTWNKSFKVLGNKLVQRFQLTLVHELRQNKIKGSHVLQSIKVPLCHSACETRKLTRCQRGQCACEHGKQRKLMRGTCVAMPAKPVAHATFSVFLFLVVFLTPAVDNMQSSELEKQPSCSKQLRPVLSNKPIAGVGTKKQNVWADWPEKTKQPFLLQHQTAGGAKTFLTKPHAQS